MKKKKEHREYVKIQATVKIIHEKRRLGIPEQKKIPELLRNSFYSLSRSPVSQREKFDTSIHLYLKKKSKKNFQKIKSFVQYLFVPNCLEKFMI